MFNQLLKFSITPVVQPITQSYSSTTKKITKNITKSLHKRKIPPTFATQKGNKAIKMVP